MGQIEPHLGRRTPSLLVVQRLVKSLGTTTAGLVTELERQVR
ncbi:MAG TPA: hypothetical protein VH120_12860 [Gemmataceae bacterium]|nr:hypothetical protein [Gemmataceae bacterium]